MDNLQIFKNEEFGEIRTVAIDEEPWFVGKDVANILGYSNPNEAIQEHIDIEDKLNSKTLLSCELNLGQRGGWLINESGLYSLVLSSKLPTAKKFKRWVTSEVLPSIRKHGAYMTEDTIQKALASPDFLIQLATKLKDEQEKNKALEEHNQRMRPKEIFADAVAASEDAILVGELAKIIKQNGHPIGQNRLFDWMRENGYLISRRGNDYNLPTQKSMELKLFRIVERVISAPDGTQKTKGTPMVTGKGQQYFVNKFHEKENKQMEFEW